MERFGARAFVALFVAGLLASIGASDLLALRLDDSAAGELVRHAPTLYLLSALVTWLILLRRSRSGVRDPAKRREGELREMRRHLRLVIGLRDDAPAPRPVERRPYRRDRRRVARTATLALLALFALPILIVAVVDDRAREVTVTLTIRNTTATSIEEVRIDGAGAAFPTIRRIQGGASGSTTRVLRRRGDGSTLFEARYREPLGETIRVIEIAIPGGCRAFTADIDLISEPYGRELLVLAGGSTKPLHPAVRAIVSTLALLGPRREGEDIDPGGQQEAGRPPEAGFR